MLPSRTCMDYSPFADPDPKSSVPKQNKPINFKNHTGSNQTNKTNKTNQSVRGKDASHIYR